MDKDSRLIQLSEIGRFWSVDFDRLSRPEQVFRAIWELEGEVDNGGFDQYFFNSSGDTAFAVVEALEVVGARETARIAAEANAVFPGALPPRNRTQRQALLDALDEDRQASLDALDERCFPDDLTELLYAYVERNAHEIHGAAEVGFSIPGSGEES